MSRKSRDAQTVSQITPAAGGDARDVDPADGHPFAEPTPMEAARRLEAAQEGEPFGAVIDELLELHRGASRATRFVFLDGPDGVGIPRIAERLAERAPVPLIEGSTAGGRAFGALETVIPALLDRADRFPGRSADSREAFRCAFGCCALWYQHTTAKPMPPWRTLAERRAAFFEGVARLTFDLSRRETPLIWLDDLEQLDLETGALLEYLLDEADLGETRGSLWIGALPPVEKRTAAVERLLAHPACQRITVAPLDYDGLRAYLSEPRVIRALLERSEGLPDRLDGILFGREVRSSAVIRAVQPRPLDVLRAMEAGPALAEQALRASAELAQRHCLEEATALVDHACARLKSPPAALLERASELHATRGAIGEALAAAERLRELRPDDPKALTRVGRLARAAGKLSLAAEALREVRQLDDAEARCEAAVELALVQLERADYASAIALSDEVLSSEDVGLDTQLEARNTRGRAAWSSGDLDFAERCFLDNEAEAARTERPTYRMRSLNNLALIRMARGRLDDARGLLTRVVQLANRHGASFHRAIALENLGVLDRLAGRYGRAIAAYQSAVRLLKPLEDRAMLVRVATNLAEVHVVLGDGRRARALLDLASSLRADDDRPEMRAERLLVEAEAAALAGDARQTKDLLEEARALALECGYQRVEEVATLLMADRAIGEERREDAAALVADLAPDTDRNRCRLAIVQATLSPDPDVAIRCARHALSLARAGGDRMLVLRALSTLASLLARAGVRAESELRLDDASQAARELEMEVPESLRESFRTLPLMLELSRTRAAVARSDGAVERPADASALRRIVGSSDAARRVRAWIERVGPTDTTVLLTGESGTGKELAAAAVHDLSARSEGPFITVNCGALMDTLLLSELFGHERGAFTGADRRRRGRFELADGGTLFLDEVGEMSASTQTALLRVLQERRFERVGGTERIDVDVRVVAATNRDLEAMVEAGTFRADLFYRLRALHLRMPPLRERPGDVAEIARALLERMEGPTVTLDRAAIELLEQHAWPGNVRELENALRAVVVLAHKQLLSREDFERHAPTLGRAGQGQGGSPGAVGQLEDLYYRALQKRGSIYEMRKDLEREAVERALDETGGNISRAAALLGMKRPRLSQLASEYGLKKKKNEES